MGSTRDKVKRAVRTPVKWGGLGLTVLLGVVWIGSAWYGRFWSLSRDHYVGIGVGQIGYVDLSATVSDYNLSDIDMGLTGFQLNWGFGMGKGAVGWSTILPLWFPTLLSLLATTAAWRADLKYIRRVRAGLCGSCGYDRAGLAAGVMCPECGAVPAPHVRAALFVAERGPALRLHGAVRSPSMRCLATRRASFRLLHEVGCFVIPNPWDVGTARFLQGLRFPALATTSAGLAFSRGLPDTVAALSREAVLAHVAEIVGATDLAVNADFQAGFGTTPDEVAQSVRLCVDTGVCGLSIEDATGVPDRPLYDLPEAVDRLRAARAAIDSSATGVLLTARAECFLVGHPDPLPESIRRLQAYADAGADVLYAPGPRTREEIRAIVRSVDPKPVNILVSANTGVSVPDLAALGVRRVSVGSALARAAWAGFIRAATPLATGGSFAGFDGLASFAELNAAFMARAPTR